MFSSPTLLIEETNRQREMTKWHAQYFIPQIDARALHIEKIEKAQHGQETGLVNVPNSSGRSKRKAPASSSCAAPATKSKRVA